MIFSIGLGTSPQVKERKAPIKVAILMKIIFRKSILITYIIIGSTFNNYPAVSEDLTVISVDHKKRCKYQV